MKTETAYITEETIQHYGVPGMRWGHRKQYDPLSGNKTGSKKKDSKPSSSLSKQTPAQRKAARQESMRAEIETLRSMGNGKMADKLQKDYDDLYGPKAAAADTPKESQEVPEKEEEKEEEKKGKGKAAATKPKAPPPKKDKSKDKAQKARELAKSQREVAKTFRQEAIAIKQEIAKMAAASNLLRSRIGTFQKDLAVAKKNGDAAAAKTLQGLVDRLNGRIAANDAAVKAQTPVAERFDAKASEWEALADETLTSLKGDKKVKQSGMNAKKVYISHYGVKGMRWGVRRTKEQLRKASGVRGAERRASAKAKTMSDSELQSTIKRMQLEKQYSSLVKDQTARDLSIIDEGTAEVGKIIARNGAQAIGTVAGTVVAYGLIEGINRYAGTSIKNKKKSG